MRILKHFIITIVLNGVMLYVITKYVPQLGFSIHSEYVEDTKTLIAIFATLGLVFWITNSLLKSILKILTLPIKYLTLGISWLVINILFIYFFEQLVNYLNIGITVSLGTFIQTCILCALIMVVHGIIKKI